MTRTKNGKLTHAQRAPRTTWRCQCGAKLPHTGPVWKWRHRKHTEGQPSGHYCDTCADNREAGIDA